MERQLLLNYTDAINVIKDAANKEIYNALLKINFDNKDALDLVKVVFAELMPGYAEQSAYLATVFYDAVRTIEVGEALGAEPITGGSMTQTDIAIEGIFNQFAESEDRAEKIVYSLLNRSSYEITRAAGECVYQNGLNDPKKPRYARVPTGTETCKWCLMLASRGFVYHSKKNAGELNHYHANCDCRIVPKFNCGKDYDPMQSDIEGYDPQEYYKKYRETLEGHELEQHYDLMTNRGKTTKRLYKTASHDYKAAGYGGKKRE